MSKQYKTAVYIGRMQPIHKAHLESIKTALDLAETLIIVVGSYNRSRSIKNPFSYEDRVGLIKESLKEFFGETDKNWKDKSPSVLDRIMFIPVRDYMYNDYKWASEIYSKCISGGATENKSTVIVGCLKDDSSYYLKMFPQWSFKRIPYLYNLDATHIRNEWFEWGKLEKYSEYVSDYVQNKMNLLAAYNKELYSDLKAEYEFLKEHKRMWDVAPYPVTFTTVDTLVIKSGCVLLIKRGTQLGKNQYAMPGGYLNGGETIEDGALRELKEETHIVVPPAVLKGSIKDVKVFDHPKRSLRGRIITHVHLIDLGYGPLPEVKGGDDASGAFWLPMADVFQSEDKFFEDHYDIIVNMTSKY